MNAQPCTPADPTVPSDNATLYLLPASGRAGARDHTTVTRADLARRLADLLGHVFGGEHAPGAPRGSGRAYFVPCDTLLAAEARQLGIRDERDLFGGVVPHPFLATKTISHPVPDPDARVPEGWSHELWRDMGDAVLPGYSTFSREAAIAAGERLLRQGQVRLKLANGVGGSGQSTVSSHAQLHAALDALDPADVHRFGVVLELDLVDPVIYSVGQLRLGDWQLAYHGTQWMTTDHRGRQVYGGSRLHVVRGGFDDLLRMPLEPGPRRAVEYAMQYDAAIGRAFPKFFASRRNYDVAAGRDHNGVEHCGVLEQSWRIGGASPAELAALVAFRDDPALEHVRASCHEVYSGEAPPPGATIHYRGEDADAGRLCKYSLVEHGPAGEQAAEHHPGDLHAA
jgi:hypothetical protein